MSIVENTTFSFDEHNSVGYTFDLANPLSQFQINLIHNTFPDDEILSAEYTRDEWLPCPIRLRLRLKDDSLEKTVYLRMTRHKDGILNEAYVLPLLHEFGLNVPHMYCPPVIDPDLPELGHMILISEVQGKDLYNYFDLNTPKGTKSAKKSILKCVDDLYSLTDRMRAVGADKVLPVVTLTDELESIKSRGGEWFSHPQFLKAYQYLSEVLPSIHDELVFSSGDINPCNFLCAEGDVPTYSFIDFSHTCFKDPLYGFATYITYGMNPFNENGLIEDYLSSVGKTWGDFHPRLLLRTLWTLQREVSMKDSNDYSNMLLNIISSVV